MKKYLTNIKFDLALIIAGCFIIFFPGFLTYFHQDDFIHLSYSQNFSQVLSAFNIFAKGQFPFYRPIPTQLYFYTAKTLFGYHPIGYHILNFIIFSLNITIVYRLGKLISGKQSVGLLSSLFYGVNSTHVAPMYSPAYVHELLYVCFSSLSAYFFITYTVSKKIKKFILTILLFILALMTKETAVVLPFIFLLILFWKKSLRKIISPEIITILIILAIYLVAHYFLYGIASGPSYKLMIGKQSINILVWYLLWAFSVPNILIDFIGPGLKLNPVFLQVAKGNAYIFFTGFTILIILGVLLIIHLIRSKKTKQLTTSLRIMAFGSAWFVTGMIPLIVFPLHKLATEQAFSLVGLSIAIATFIYTFHKEKQKYRYVGIAIILVYVIVAGNSIFLARRTHWIVRSATQAESTVNYMLKNYPRLSNSDIVYFRDGEMKIAAYGSSKQIYYSLGNGIALNLIYNRPGLKVFFQSENPGILFPPDKKVITLDSSQFLGY